MDEAMEFWGATAPRPEGEVWDSISATHPPEFWDSISQGK